tara:strand:- start:9407 stop:10315 length:909 start_codon:yes stop_codon:yes gene_type:complete
MVLLLRVFCVAIVLGFVAPTSSWADTARERAGKHVNDGDQLKVEAEEAKADGKTTKALRLFDAAAEEYQAAYDLVPHPLMLYNLAQVSRLAGKQQEALDFYNEFLETKPVGEAADFARTYVRLLERSLARSRERGDDDDDTGDDDDDDTGDDDDNTGDDDDNPFGDNDDDPGVTPKTSDPGKGLRYGGLGLAAAGVVSIAVGVKFGLDAQNISNCLTNYPSDCDTSFPDERWTDEALLLEREGQSASNKMILFTSLGAVAIVAGGALYYLGDSKTTAAEKTSVSVAPQVSPHSVGVGFSGSF